MKPVAWAVFTENGNIRIWSPDQEPVRKAAEKEGLSITPLYPHPDKYRAALQEQLDLVGSPIVTNWPDIAARLISIAKAALEI